MVTRVLGQDATDDWAKAGIMLRDTTADNAAYVLLALTPQRGVTFQARETTGSGSVDLHDTSPMMAPTWLKLVRHNTTITGFVSADGTTWTTVSSVTLAMGATSSIGLAVTAHNNKVRSRAVFSNVKLTLGQATPALTASRVYGQPDFTSNTINNGGVSTTSLSHPQGSAVDSGGNLYIADGSNNRVLYYPVGTTTATRVYGQPDFTSNTVNNGGVSATSLSSPGAVAVDSSGNLYVADRNNNRVLYYPSGTTTATRVYGQGGDFTTNTVNKGGVSANSLNYPWGVAVDGSNNLYILDYYNNRVLYYPVGTTTATQVYGQGGDFTTNTVNNGGISANSLNYPYGITVDSSGNLYITDYSNNRVLMFPHA